MSTKIQAKKKGSDLMKEDIKNQLSQNGYVKTIKTELDHLKNILRAWNLSRNGTYYFPSKDAQLIKSYVKSKRQYYEQDQFNQHFTLLENFDVNLFLVGDESLIFKSFNLFPRAIWPVRFHSKFQSRLASYTNSDQIFLICSHLYSLACGMFCESVSKVHTKTIPFNRFLTVKLLKQRNLLIHIGVQKVPIIRNGVIKRYEYTQFMHFLDILGDQYIESASKIAERMNYFTNTIYDDAAKKDHSEQIQIDREKFTKFLHHQQKSYFFREILNEYTDRHEYYDASLPEKSSQIYYPIPFKPYYVSSSENTTIIYDKERKRWLSKDHLSILERKKLLQYQKQISDVMVKRFVDFQSAKSLVELLTKIPNFKINLTEQEKDVIGENGNVLAIGRSGTGKTTCAVLRLFSIEMLFKIRLSLYKKKFVDTLKEVRCGSNDIETAAGLHCIFLTASPVLTHEIQRYYKKLTDNIKSQLEKKKKRVEVEQKKQRERINREEHQEKSCQESFEQLNASEEEIKENNEKIEEKIDIQAPATLLPKKSAEELEEEQQMNEQFEGIELKEDLNNQEFKEEEEDIDEMKNKFEESIKKFHSLYDLNESDYPGFFTVRSFIMMVDGVLAKPFFIRSKNTIINEDSKASWHNERKGVMMIENYYKGEGDKQPLNADDLEEEFNYSDEEELQHQYLRQIQLRENKDKQQLTKKLLKNKIANVYSFEVDYDYFVVHFWPKVIKRYYCSRNITPHLVWTQIYSTIKGSAEAHQYPGQYLNQQIYMNTSTNTFLTRQEKLDIYETFCQYERWKIRAGGYDILDAVNYILNYIRFRGYEGPEIHYVMIDEVQDLPHAMVYLLSKIATYGVFYSGDTAQTIAKGVGFRFCDLRTLFNNLSLKAPITKHLTINFRSHNNILQVANSIVSSLEVLFPKTIDRLKKQVSNLKGPKPMILDSNDEQLLFYVLCGGEEQKVEGSKNLKKPPLEFGCDQVIIVRDQESKNKVPAMLQHALCLTIYEAKGLEFNDVILFNFFEESPCPQKWGLLKSLNIVTVDVPKDEYERNFSRHTQKKQEEKQIIGEKPQEAADVQSEVEVQQFFNKQKNMYEVKKITCNISKQFKDINDYAELCSELKLLYTAITRPKKTLIIYDDGQAPARSSLEKLWTRLNLIQMITKQLVLDLISKKSTNEEVKIFETIVTATDKNQWKQQGLKMYARGYFDQAMKCFDKSGHEELYKKAEANKYADEATKKLIQIESQRNAIKQGGYLTKEMNHSELSRYKKKLKGEESSSLKKFVNAAAIFQDLLMFKQAGQCYFSGKTYEKAFQSFCKVSMNRQAAESLEMQSKYKEAAEYYDKDGNYLKVIECLDMVNEWVLILQKLHKFADKMTEFEKQALLKKYSALALEELVYEIEFENEQESVKPENNRVEIIEEKQSDEEEEWDQDEDSQLAAERQQERQRSKELSKNSEQEKGLIEIKQSVYEQLGEKDQKQDTVRQEKQDEASMSFSALNSSEPSIQQKQQVEVNEEKGIKSIDESFGDLNRSEQPIVLEAKSEQKFDLESIQSSFSDLNAKYQNDLQPDLQSIKSMVDPEDIWIKNSISQITHKLHSEYSVIDNEQENYNINVKIIKTKGNIFVQDEIMKKIINIVSIINSSVQEFFTQFKGYQSLITVSNGENSNDVIDSRPEISEFEDVDPKFINIILDTLESFKLFKLCLFVCNRYHLPVKAGRYLISLGMKYSTNCISNNIVNPILLAPSAYRKTELERGILASIAIHSIYENVNSEFLKIKVTENDEDNKNTLGNYFIEGLVLQGLYKKAIFMVNPQESLRMLANYNDFDAYNNIYRQKILKNNQDDALCFLPKLKSHEDFEFAKMQLRKIIFEYCVANKFETVSQRYYKQFTSQNEVDLHKRLSSFTLPNYLPFSKILISGQTAEFITKFKNIISQGYKILTTGNSLQVLDFVFTLLAIIHSEQLQRHIVQALSNNEFLDLYHCSNYIKSVLRKIAGRNALIIIEAIFNIHQCYRINYCKSMNFINDTFCFVNRTSTIANELVENQKINNGNFAYFFEQDYNFILTKTSRAIKIISKKYEDALYRLYHKKTLYTRHNITFLYEDWIATQQEVVIKKALTYDIKHIGDPKKKKKQQVAKTKKSKELIKNYDFKCRGREHVIRLEQSSDSEVEEYVDKELKFYRYNSNEKLKYLAPSMLQWFNQQSSNSKEIVEGQDLYCSGIASSYREYLQKRGGFNLYDALEFQRFKRVDLFAENVLSVYAQLTLYTKHNLLAEILILLLVQYKALEEPKGFSVTVTTSCLKYFQNLRLISLKSKTQLEVSLSSQQINYLLSDNKECIFSYINHNVSEMNKSDICGIICDYLEMLQEQEYSKFVQFSNIILVYVININKNDEINECLRKIIKNLGLAWKNQSLHYLIDNKGLGDYENKRKKLLDSPVKQIIEPLHNIEVDNKASLQDAIAESEFDYELEGRILKGRAKAATKICKWWKAKRIQLKNKRGLAENYFQLAVNPLSLQDSKKPFVFGDIRLINLIHKGAAFKDIDLFIKTEKAKSELLSFYLTNTIASSLDFHFILMSLNKIDQCRKHFFQYCSEDVDELHEFDIDEIHQEMGEMLNTIQTWKKDEKWLRDKNINFKRKKVFEVKWMTKNMGFGNILKKRAGLKKQALLQQKRKMIKRLK